MKNKFYALLFILIAIPINAKEINDIISGTVHYVVDGDTIVVKDKDFIKYKIRIFGIDTPELQKSKGRGEFAKAFMAGLVYVGKNKASCRVVDMDRYKRYVAVCENSQGDLAEILLKNNQAKIFHRYFDYNKYVSDKTKQRYRDAYKNRTDLFKEFFIKQIKITL